MPKITLCLDENKKLEGISLKDQRAWSNFKFKVANLGDSCIIFEYREPRSGPFHRRHFSMLKSIFESQDTFKDAEVFRKWAQVEVGYVQHMPTVTGEIFSIPDSIAYDKLDQAAFQELHDKVFAFLISLDARRLLWPHLADGVSEQMIESLLGEFA